MVSLTKLCSSRMDFSENTTSSPSRSRSRSQSQWIGLSFKIHYRRRRCSRATRVVQNNNYAFKGLKTSPYTEYTPISIPTHSTMVRTSSSKATTSAAPSAVAASATPSVKKAAAPKKEKAVKEESAAPAAAAASAPVEEENKVVSETSEVASKLVELTAQVHQLTNILSATKGNLKVLEKSINKELKAAQKSAGKKKKRDGSSRKPSGFNIPTLISDELAAFLGKPTATKLARVEVTNAFNTYIKANSLHDPTNGRYILPDAALTRLLKLTPTDRLSYFNLQAFIKHHFIKEAAAPAAV